MKNLTEGHAKKVKRCRRGHRLVHENIYPRKDGYKSCRECMLLADKRYRARQKAQV